MSAPTLIPVTVLTGFLGSGKTTILNQLLRRAELADTLAIINEFGEIGLDHLLIEQSEETLVLLDNGCLCCTVRDDLVKTLCDLAQRRQKGEISAFRRIVIETTGLADPAPILHTLMTEPDVAAHHRLDGVITTIDAINGERTLAHYDEAVRQAAVADRLLITKGDLAAPTALAALRRNLRELNRGAPMVEVQSGRLAPDMVFGVGLFDAAGKAQDVRRWLQAEAAHDHDLDHAAHRHDSAVQTRSVIIEQPVSWADFSSWLELMAAMRGEAMLRVKGIVKIAEDPDRPLVIHGVQHVFHPPVRLDAWPDADHRTRLVFITRGLPAELIDSTLVKFAHLGPERIKMN